MMFKDLETILQCDKKKYSSQDLQSRRTDQYRFYSVLIKSNRRSRSKIKSAKTNTYSLDLHNLSTGLLHLAQSAQEIPESRLGNNDIRSKDPHAVQLWVLVIVSRQLAPSDAEFLQLQLKRYTLVNKKSCKFMEYIK